MQLQNLGHVQMTVHEERLTVSSTKVRGLLGVLSYKYNDPVRGGQLAEALWDDDLSPRLQTTLQTYVCRWRRVLAESGAPVTGKHDDGSYRLVVDPSVVDYQRFVTTGRAGHRAFGVGEHADAARATQNACTSYAASGPRLKSLRTSTAGETAPGPLSRRTLLDLNVDHVVGSTHLGAGMFATAECNSCVSESNSALFDISPDTQKVHASELGGTSATANPRSRANDRTRDCRGGADDEGS